MKTLLERTRAAKELYCRKTGEWPDQLFLGPAEYREFTELIAEHATFYFSPRSGMDIKDAPAELMGMKIIGLMSDGLRAGHTECEDNP